MPIKFDDGLPADRFGSNAPSTCAEGVEGAFEAADSEFMMLMRSTTGGAIIGIAGAAGTGLSTDSKSTGGEALAGCADEDTALTGSTDDVLALLVGVKSSRS
jgi:hypothetical protein